MVTMCVSLLGTRFRAPCTREDYMVAGIRIREYQRWEAVYGFIYRFSLTRSNCLAGFGGLVVVILGGALFCVRIERYNRLALSYMLLPTRRGGDKAFDG
jgi:hypothetical protein